MIPLDGRPVATITRAIGDAKFAFVHLLINEISFATTDPFFP